MRKLLRGNGKGSGGSKSHSERGIQMFELILVLFAMNILIVMVFWLNPGLNKLRRRRRKKKKPLFT